MIWMFDVRIGLFFIFYLDIMSVWFVRGFMVSIV